jgi:hypothetical protein
LLNKLTGVKTLGHGEYAAICPAHKDLQPSLHIKQEGDKLLLNCKAGCPIEAVTAAIGITMADLWDEQTVKAKIVDEYDYVDEGGELIYQVVRYEPKSFKQRHRTASGGWSWNMEGVRRVLYHLDLIQDAKLVYLVEGEKDADSLVKRGMVATTSPGGANAWKPEYAQYLKGKKVVIIPDKDSAGYNYALKAANSLEGIATVMCIIFPSADVKDTSDWLAQGGNSANLVDMELPVNRLTSLTSLTSKTELTRTDIELTSLTNEDGLTRTDKCLTNPQGKIIWGLVDDWLEMHQDEKFDLDTICRHLDIKNRDDRHHVIKKLSYEVEHKNIEKSDKVYRYIYKELNIINWYSTNVEYYLPIVFPSSHKDGNTYLNFQDSVRLSPASVTVIAGQTNAGKSCLARNLVWDNMDRMPVRYMVSQTSGHAFHRYALNMPWADPMIDGKPKFELIEHYENFQDVIRPDALNIVDWLDADKVEYYKIGSLIKAMQTKVTTGALVVCIQKNSDKDYGDGGIKSAKWADLYLSLSYNREKNFTRLEVMKAKEWIGNSDPNGKSYGFEIIDYGAQLSNIREVKKCVKCWGHGKDKKGDDCGACYGIGWIDMPYTRPYSSDMEF